jgi:hypothetical protein
VDAFRIYATSFGLSVNEIGENSQQQ